MKIFISYSTADISLVHSIAKHIQPHAQIFYWDKDKTPGMESWPCIFGWIDQADMVLVLITDNTVRRAMSVGQEVGHAEAKKKLIVPLVAPGIHDKELGCLNGIVYARFDPSKPIPALARIQGLVTAREKKIKEDQMWAGFWSFSR